MKPIVKIPRRLFRRGGACSERFTSSQIVSSFSRCLLTIASLKVRGHLALGESNATFVVGLDGVAALPQQALVHAARLVGELGLVRPHGQLAVLALIELARLLDLAVKGLDLERMDPAQLVSAH